MGNFLWACSNSLHISNQIETKFIQLIPDIRIRTNGPQKRETLFVTKFSIPLCFMFTSKLKKNE